MNGNSVLPVFFMIMILPTIVSLYALSLELVEEPNSFSPTNIFILSIKYETLQLPVCD